MWQCPKCGERLGDGIAACWICGTQPDGTEDPDFVAETMPAEPQADVETASTPPRDLPAPDSETRRYLWIEVAVVAAIVVLPDLWWSIVQLTVGPPAVGFAVERMDVLVRSFVLSLVVLYLIWRSGDSWRQFGLMRLRWSDVWLGLLVFVSVLVIGGVVRTVTLLSLPPEVMVSIVESTFQPQWPSRPSQWALEVVMNLGNGFAEELTIRAYLFLRLRQLMHSTARALALSSLLFASYHIYQGWWALDIFVFGMLLGLAFLWIRRLWPIALAHALYNISLAVNQVYFT